jgi:hypothetical protein
MSAPRLASIVFDVGQMLDDRAAHVAAAAARGRRGIVPRSPAATEAWLAGRGVQVAS